jgi:hypothetical protein
MSVEEGRLRLLPIGTGARCSRHVSILVIGGLSLLSWAALIEAVVAVRSFL